MLPTVTKLVFGKPHSARIGKCRKIILEEKVSEPESVRTGRRLNRKVPELKSARNLKSVRIIQNLEESDTKIVRTGKCPKL